MFAVAGGILLAVFVLLFFRTIVGFIIWAIGVVIVFAALAGIFTAIT